MLSEIWMQCTMQCSISYILSSVVVSRVMLIALIALSHSSNWYSRTPCLLAVPAQHSQCWFRLNIEFRACCGVWVTTTLGLTSSNGWLRGNELISVHFYTPLLHGRSTFTSEYTRICSWQSKEVKVLSKCYFTLFFIELRWMKLNDISLHVYDSRWPWSVILHMLRSSDHIEVCLRVHTYTSNLTRRLSFLQRDSTPAIAPYPASRG